MTASQIQPETLLADRERWVARGVSAPAIVAVSADGAHVQGADGVRYLDFAGGIGCQNLGHNPEAVVEAIHAQVDAYLHQCFMVAAYEPYVDVCRKLGELSPCRGDRPEVDPASTRAPRRSRTRSRSPAPRPAARRSSASTAASTAAR